MDSQAAWRLVLASDFHVPWSWRVLARVDRQLLARRIYLARRAACIAGDGRFLLDFFHACHSPGGDLFGLVPGEIDCPSAAGALAGVIELCCARSVPSRSIHRI